MHIKVAPWSQIPGRNSTRGGGGGGEETLRPCRSMAGMKMMKCFHVDGEQLLPHRPFPAVAPGLSRETPGIP